MIQKFAKTAPSIPSCVGGPVLQIFGSLYFVKYVLKKTDFINMLSRGGLGIADQSGVFKISFENIFKEALAK